MHLRGTVDAVVNRYDAFRSWLAEHGFHGPLWVTELGYPADPAFQTDPAYKDGDASQAAYLTQSLLGLGEAGAPEVFVTLRDNSALEGKYVSEGLEQIDETPGGDYPVTRRASFAAVHRLIENWDQLLAWRQQQRDYEQDQRVEQAKAAIWAGDARIARKQFHAARLRVHAAQDDVARPRLPARTAARLSRRLDRARALLAGRRTLLLLRSAISNWHSRRAYENAVAVALLKQRIAAMRVAVSRAPGAERVVTPLELFFDLVYVFAIGQLSHHLLAHVDLRTGAETAILALAVFYAWYMVAWGANWLDPDRLPVRLLLVGLMFASLLMSVAIADAFDERAWLFVTGYLLLQVGRCGFLIVALRGRPLGEHFVNDLVWELLDRRASGWPARSPTATPGSCSGGSRWWPPTSACGPCTGCPAVAGAIDLEHTEIAAGHLIERFRLFFIIVLGETVLTTGTAFTDEPFALERLLALAIGFAGTSRSGGATSSAPRRSAPEAAETADDAGAVGLVGHVDADAHRARADRDRGRRRARDRPSRRRRDARLHDPHVRRAGAVPVRPDPLPPLGARTCPALAPDRSGGARDPRGRHRPLTLIAGIAASSAVLVATAIADTRPAGAAPESARRARPRAASAPARAARRARART